MESTGSKNNMHEDVEEEENIISSIIAERHEGIICDGCTRDPLLGQRYKCLVCEDYDLCEICKDAGCHPEHEFRLISKPFKRWGRCEACKEPTEFPAYRCTECSFYILCERCKMANVHNEHLLQAVEGNEFLHYHYSCDGCNEAHIRGYRYRCKTCRMWNLCEFCKKRGIHRQHEMIKFDGTEVVHEGHSCKICYEYRIKGNRYRCNTCDVFDICECCKTRGAHNEHQFTEFDGPELDDSHYVPLVESREWPPV